MTSTPIDANRYPLLSKIDTPDDLRKLPESDVRAVADELLDRGMPERPRPAMVDWVERTSAICRELREAMLAYRDGAELVSTVHAFGLGAARPGALLAEVLLDAGLAEQTVPTATRTLLHFVFGHTLDEQTHLQAAAAGALTDPPRTDSDFELGLAIVVDGVRLRVGVASRA